MAKFGVAGMGALLGGGMLIASAVRSGDAKDFAQTCRDEGTFAGFVTAGAAFAFAIPYTIAATSGEASGPDDVAFVPVIAPDFQGVFVRSRF